MGFILASRVSIAGLIVSIIILVLQIVGVIVMVVVFAHLAGECASLGPGVHEVNGTTYTCS